MLTRVLKSCFGSKQPIWHGTTILAVKKNKEIVLAGDGQVSYGPTKVKTNGRKIRKLENSSAVCGFAGSLADAFTLMEGLENMMSKYPDQTMRACIKYAKEWRTGKYLRHLQATLLVCDKNLIVELDGTGNVIEIDGGAVGIGSGGAFAECAAKALLDIDGLTAEDIAMRSMKIAASKCIYTNENFIMEKVKWD